MRTLWPHGICPTTCWTIASSGPGLAERPHVFQISRREALHVGECPLEVRRQTVDHFRAPVFPVLPVQDIAPDLPIEQDQFPVDGQRRAKLRCPNPSLQVGEKLSGSCRERVVPPWVPVILYCRLWACRARRLPFPGEKTQRSISTPDQLQCPFPRVPKSSFECHSCLVINYIANVRHAHNPGR